MTSPIHFVWAGEQIFPFSHLLLLLFFDSNAFDFHFSWMKRSGKVRQIKERKWRIWKRKRKARKLRKMVSSPIIPYKYTQCLFFLFFLRFSPIIIIIILSPYVFSFLYLRKYLYERTYKARHQHFSPPFAFSHHQDCSPALFCSARFVSILSQFRPSHPMEHKKLLFIYWFYLYLLNTLTNIQQFVWILACWWGCSAQSRCGVVRCGVCVVARLYDGPKGRLLLTASVHINMSVMYLKSKRWMILKKILRKIVEKMLEMEKNEKKEEEDKQ